MKIYEAIIELIGNMTLLELKTIELTHRLNGMRIQFIQQGELA